MYGYSAIYNMNVLLSLPEANFQSLNVVSLQSEKFGPIFSIRPFTKRFQLYPRSFTQFKNSQSLGCWHQFYISKKQNDI